jgi:hypothetical protein
MYYWRVLEETSGARKASYTCSYTYGTRAKLGAGTRIRKLVYGIVPFIRLYIFDLGTRRCVYPGLFVMESAYLRDSIFEGE